MLAVSWLTQVGRHWGCLGGRRDRAKFVMVPNISCHVSPEPALSWAAIGLEFHHGSSMMHWAPLYLCLLPVTNSIIPFLLKFCCSITFYRSSGLWGCRVWIYLNPLLNTFFLCILLLLLVLLTCLLFFSFFSSRSSPSHPSHNSFFSGFGGWPPTFKSGVWLPKRQVFLVIVTSVLDRGGNNRL